VQFTHDGTQLTSRADDPDNLQASFAYIEQLARHIATPSAPRAFRNPLRSADKKGGVRDREAEISVLITSPKANLTALVNQLS